MTEVTSGSLWRLRVVKHLKVVLGIRHLNHLFFSFIFFFFFLLFFFFFFSFFSGGWLRGGSFVLDLSQQKWFYFKYPLWSWAWVEKARHDDVD